MRWRAPHRTLNRPWKAQLLEFCDIVSAVCTKGNVSSEQPRMDAFLKWGVIPRYANTTPRENALRMASWELHYLVYDWWLFELRRINIEFQFLKLKECIALFRYFHSSIYEKMLRKYSFHIRSKLNESLNFIPYVTMHGVLKQKEL